MSAELDDRLAEETLDAPYGHAPVAEAEGGPAWIQRHLAMLAELGEMGMQLARNVTRQALAQTEAELQAQTDEAPPRRAAPAGDPALTFSRIARAVRLSIILEANLRRQQEAVDVGAANDDAPVGADGGPIDYAAIRRRMQPVLHGKADYEIRRAVEETIEAAHDDAEAVERLKDELVERLDEDEVFLDRAHWPIGETIALICQDLGLEPDWERWTGRRWARTEAAESPPGSPYATEARPPPPPNQRPRTGTETYREARGLPPLEASPPRAARGPP